MKGFLVGLVVVAAIAGGYYYGPRVVLAPRAPDVADEGAPAKESRLRRKRRRRGARRLARNDALARNDTFEAAPPAYADAPPTYAAPSEEPTPPAEKAAPLAPGGSSTTEVAPSDVFGALSSPTPGSGGGRRQPTYDEPAPVKLGPADLRIVGQGEALSSRPEVTRLDMSDNGHELSQDEIDAGFRAKEDAVLGCIARARPDEYTWIPGQVTVRFRILRTGAVRGVRVEAPAILQKGGLYGCVKGVVGGMKFPAGNMNQVVAYPFSLT